MKTIKYLAFFASLPFFAAVAFDLLLSISKEPFEIVLTTPGYIWTQYHPESYEAASKSLNPALWDIITTVLSLKTIIVTGVLAGFFWAFVFAGKLMGAFMPSTKRGNFSGNVNRGDAIVGRKKGQFHYKRK